MRTISQIFRMLDRRLITGAIGAGLIGLAAAAWADPITTPGLTIVDGDKTFTDFTCSISGTGSALFTCDELSVVAYTNGAGELGIAFQGTLTALQNSTLDVFITYDAFINSGTQLFDDAVLVYNGNVVTSVLENIYQGSTASVGPLIGTLNVFNPPATLTDSILLAANVSAIHVTKDIGLNCLSPQTTGCGQANISIVQQNFSQTAPEPGSLALLATALVGAGWFGRRRSNRS